MKVIYDSLTLIDLFSAESVNEDTEEMFHEKKLWGNFYCQSTWRNCQGINQKSIVNLNPPTVLLIHTARGGALCPVWTRRKSHNRNDFNFQTKLLGTTPSPTPRAKPPSCCKQTASVKHTVIGFDRWTGFMAPVSASSLENCWALESRRVLLAFWATESLAVWQFVYPRGSSITHTSCCCGGGGTVFHIDKRRCDALNTNQDYFSLLLIQCDVD